MMMHTVSHSWLLRCSSAVYHRGRSLTVSSRGAYKETVNDIGFPGAETATDIPETVNDIGDIGEL